MIFKNIIFKNQREIMFAISLKTNQFRIATAVSWKIFNLDSVEIKVLSVFFLLFNHHLNQFDNKNKTDSVWAA